MKESGRNCVFIKFQVDNSFLVNAYEDKKQTWVQHRCAGCGTRPLEVIRGLGTSAETLGRCPLPWVSVAGPGFRKRAGSSPSVWAPGSVLLPPGPSSPVRAFTSP